MTKWTFLTKHAQALLCIARDPDITLRDLASTLAITERHTHSIVTDLTESGYVIKRKDGRRNRYQVQDHLPLPELSGEQAAIGDVLRLLTHRPQPAGRTTRSRQRGRNGPA